MKLDPQIRYLIAANRGIQACYFKWFGQPQYTMRDWAERGALMAPPESLK